MGAAPAPESDGLCKMERWQNKLREMNLADQVAQRVALGDSLKQIIQDWQVPKTAFLTWVAANPELTEQVKRLRELMGIELRMEGLEIIDDATPEDIAVARERARYRADMSKALNKPLFGDQVAHSVEIQGLSETLRLISEKKNAQRRARLIEADVTVIPDKQDNQQGEAHDNHNDLRQGEEIPGGTDANERAHAHERQNADEKNAAQVVTQVATHGLI